MTTLRAKPVSLSALNKKRTQAVLDELRVRIENDPGCGQMPRLRKAEQALMMGSSVGEAIAEITRELDRRAEAAETEANLVAQAVQAEVRGVETVREHRGPPSRDGIIWLARKGRLTTSRRLAAERVSELYGKARADGVRSHLAEPCGGGAFCGRTDPHLLAADELRALQEHMTVASGLETGARLYGLLISVCGNGTTLRELAKGDDRKASVLEADLMTALDMAGVKFGMVKARGQAA